MSVEPVKTASVALAFRLTLFAALTEIVLIVAWTLRNGSPDAPVYAGLVWALFKVFPLLIVLPGLLRGSHRAATWFCFLLCAYFMGAVMLAIEPGTAGLVGGIEIGLILAGFVAGLLATRWRRAQEAQDQAASTNLAPPP